MRCRAAPVLICAALISCLAYAGSYGGVRIVAPEPDTTVHDNNGNLTVTVEVSPGLDAAGGDQLTLLLDDQAVASGFRQNFELEGIDRGMHTLQAQVNAADGTVRATSPPVTFYMWRASRLFRGRTN